MYFHILAIFDFTIQINLLHTTSPLYELDLLWTPLNSKTMVILNKQRAICFESYIPSHAIGSKDIPQFHVKRKRKCGIACSWRNGILLPKLFWPTGRKKISSDWEKLLKLETESQEFAKFLRSLEFFFQTVKGQNNFWY